MILKDLQELLEDLLHDDTWDDERRNAETWCEVHQTEHPDGADHDVIEAYPGQHPGEEDIVDASGLDAQEEHLLLQAMDRSTNEIDSASHAEVAAWLSDHAATPEELAGVNANLRGIYGEMRVLEILNNQDDGLHYELAESTNNPGVDIYGYDAQGHIVRQIQVKMSDSESYIRESTADLPPNIEVIVPDEMGHIEGTRTIGLRLSDIEGDTGTFLQSLSAPKRENISPAFRLWMQRHLVPGVGSV